MPMHQAQDSFSAEVDGASIFVRKGEVFPASHPLVKLDNDSDGKPRELLFRPLDEDVPVTMAKSAPKAAAGGGGS